MLATLALQTSERRCQAGAAFLLAACIEILHISVLSVCIEILWNSTRSLVLFFFLAGRERGGGHREIPAREESRVLGRAGG